jgi:hypothetical protein
MSVLVHAERAATAASEPAPIDNSRRPGTGASARQPASGIARRIDDDQMGANSSGLETDGLAIAIRMAISTSSGSTGPCPARFAPAGNTAPARGLLPAPLESRGRLRTCLTPCNSSHGAHRQPTRRANGTFWEGVRAKAKLGDARIHDLRHTFASLLVSGSMTLPMVGWLLGHTQAQTTLRYAHLCYDPLRAGLDEVGEALRPKLRLVDTATAEPGDPRTAGSVAAVR